jgi:hypothetical protein
MHDLGNVFNNFRTKCELGIRRDHADGRSDRRNVHSSGVMTQPNDYPYLVTWFEIPAAELDRAAKFYSDVLGVSMRVDQIGRERLSVFPHQKPSVGGCLTVGGQPPASAIPKVTS